MASTRFSESCPVPEVELVKVPGPAYAPCVGLLPLSAAQYVCDGVAVLPGSILSGARASPRGTFGACCSAAPGLPRPRTHAYVRLLTV